MTGGRSREDEPGKRKRMVTDLKKLGKRKV
jgi:hypothetical protein